MTRPARRIGFVVNSIAGLKPSQTSAMLAVGAAARGDEVWIQDADAFALDADGRVRATARPMVSADGAPSPQPPGATVDADWLETRAAHTVATVALLADAPRQEIVVDDLDALILRVNPGRESRRWVQETLLDFARIVRDRGVVVLNDPDGLAAAGNKLYLRKVPPDYRPVTMVTRDRARIRRFVEDQGEQGAVLKPLLGTRGNDVFLVRGTASNNLNQIVDVLTRDGYAMVQSFVPEAVDGDVRLIVVDGELLEVSGAAAAVRRVPAADDFRSNVFQGGQATAARATEAMRACVDAVGPTLAADGIFLAGLDFIGGKLVEVNVAAAGGLDDAEHFYRRDFITPVLDAIDARIDARDVAG